MPDMLVNLRDLPSPNNHPMGLTVRRANGWDKFNLCQWVAKNFSTSWAECCEMALEQRPVTCFVIVDHLSTSQEKLMGFACYDVAGKGIFGPMGISQVNQKKGLGAALLTPTLVAMRDEGYVYAIIGQVGPVEFYTKTVGATLIENSDPGSARVHLC